MEDMNYEWDESYKAIPIDIEQFWRDIYAKKTKQELIDKIIELLLGEEE